MSADLILTRTEMETRQNFKYRRSRDLLLLLLFCLIVVLSGLMGMTLLSIPQGIDGLGLKVSEKLHLSGVESPVTAVLLNFRGYDTMLEVVVLLLAVIGVWSMAKAPISLRSSADAGPVQNEAVRLLTPLMLLAAAYLVWQGSHLAGGAFQGGAVLGAAGVLLLVSELAWLQKISALPLRSGLVLGPFVFLGVAIWCMVAEGIFLAYPQGASGALLLLIETFCAISIGLTLASLFAGGRPKDDLLKRRENDNQPFI